MCTNQRLHGNPTKESLLAPCADLLHRAEREMAAFISAVDHLFGFEHSQRAAEYWIEHLEKMSLPRNPTPPLLRQVTIAAASHFASTIPQGRT